MALRPFNSTAGFTVGETPSIDVIYANGDVSAVNFAASGLSNLGIVSNVTILGGQPGQFLSTDGNGNLSFSPSQSNVAAPMPYNINTGDSYIVPNNFQGLFSYPITIDGTLDVEGLLIEVGTPINSGNSQILFDSDSTLTGNAGFTFIPTSGNLYVPGNIVPTGNVVPLNNNVSSLGTPTQRFSNIYLSGNTIYLGAGLISTASNGDIVLTSGSGASFDISGNATTSVMQNGNSNIAINANSTINLSSNGIANVMVVNSNVVTITGNLQTTGILTDHYYHANGVPVDFGGAAGSNTWIQYSNGTDLAASANLTYNDATQTLTVNGNIASNNTITGGYLVSNSGCVTIGTAALAVINGTGGVFNSGVSNINIGLNSNLVLGSTTGTITTRNDLIANGNISTTNTVIANNVEVGDLYSKRTPIAVNSADTIIDTFPVSSYRSAKYTIKAKSDLGYQALEVLLLQDSINTFITVYASLSSAALGAETVLITAQINSGNVDLLATPYSSNTIVNLMGTYVPD